MGLWIDVVRVAAALNVVLLLGMSVVWGRNYRSVRSKHTLGLLVFGLLLLAENALALWVFGMDPMLARWFTTKVQGPPGHAMAVLRVLESGAILFLAWVSLD
ncbi:MAG: hypothetical protein ABEJ70_01980 [Halobacteriaceae archaeon]